MGQGVKAHWEAGTDGHYFHNDLWYGSGLYKRLVINVSGHADWSSLGVLVVRPCSIRETITRSWSTPYRGYTSHPHPLPSPSPSLGID